MKKSDRLAAKQKRIEARRNRAYQNAFEPPLWLIILFHPFESFRFLVEEVFSKKKVEPLNHDAL
jgi:hypothetical protein